jgi:predicted dehydrogenase
MNEVKLLTLDPGHFHAALVQKEMYPDVSKQVHIFAPLGADLLAHLNRISGFNTRPERPTAWELEVHTGHDFLQRLLREPPGNVVVLSGRNRGKIDYIQAAVNAGLNVLADKPWIITTADLFKLEAVLNQADAQSLIAFDIMTERYEITSILQKELVNDPEIFGVPDEENDESVSVFMESVHFLMKTVAGVPLRRPAWFFDVAQQGEGLTDVGTHLVDLVPWILFPDAAIDYRTEIKVLGAQRWPTVLTKADFQRVTGEADFPNYLASSIHDGKFDYFCNTGINYTVRGIPVELKILWNFEAAAGAGDTHLAIFHGPRSQVEIQQGPDQNYRPELYVVPNEHEDSKDVHAALERKVAALQKQFPGIAVRDRGVSLHVTIPDSYRVGHEAHFAQVTQQFLKYLRSPRELLAWEKANMLAKYFVTTKGVELALKDT